MDSKNYTQVLIDGKIYTLGGIEEEAYLQKAASYVNDKNAQMRRLPGNRGHRTRQTKGKAVQAADRSRPEQLKLQLHYRPHRPQAFPMRSLQKGPCRQLRRPIHTGAGADKAARAFARTL